MVKDEKLELARKNVIEDVALNYVEIRRFIKYINERDKSSPGVCSLKVKLDNHHLANLFKERDKYWNKAIKLGVEEFIYDEYSDIRAI
jgi:hypothetical protein